MKALIARLDPGSFTTFISGLLLAEGYRVGLNANALVVSDALTENDEGLDALAAAVPDHAGAEPPSPLPTGLVGFQLKTTSEKRPGALRLPRELRQPGPKRVLVEGGTYVLVWSQDLNPAQRERAGAVLRAEAAKVLDEEGVQRVPHVALWDAQTLAGLCAIHPAPAVDIGLTDFGAALSLGELLAAVLRATERPFQSDAARDDLIARLRERATVAPEDPLLMRIHGDPGAGKTRAVAHALDTDELHNLVLCVSGPEDLNILLTRMMRNRASRGILFADEIDDHQAAEAWKRISGLDGRWRIVSIASRPDPSWIAEGGRNVVLPPLDQDATRLLVEQHSGLPEVAARMVAEVASGFPELAFRLADELKNDPSLDLVRLARLPHPQEVLQRALTDPETRRHLAPIALFAGVGFDGELAYELDAVAATFELNPAELRRYCDAELEARRFVSRSGRYRSISPLLVAVWLATDLIERTPEFGDLIFQLPEPLQTAFIQQLDFFGPDVPHLPTALSLVLADERFRRPERFDEAAGRLLRASAAIIPTQVAHTIAELVTHSDGNDLARLPRRDLVWALEILLWWPDSWEPAIESLFRLAQAENETWANNATSQFASAFAVYLAGTTVPYERRARWLRSAIDRAATTQLPLLADAAAAGLRSHHYRSVVGFRGGGEPDDWQPGTEDEYMAARRTAWDLLVLVRDRAPAEIQSDFGVRLNDAVQVAYGDGIGAAVDESIRDRTWAVQERAAIAAGLRKTIRYERFSPTLLAEAKELHDWLLGDDLRERALVILSTSLWDLHESQEGLHDPPSLLVDLAERLAQDPDGLRVGVELGRDLDQQDTRYTLFRLLAQRLGAERVGAEAQSARDFAALSAAVSVADAAQESGWATRVLRELAKTEPWRVPELLTYLDLTRERLELALEVAERTPESGAALGRLLFGARVKDLDEALFARLLEAVHASGATEAALGMLSQWLEDNTLTSDRVRAVAGELATAGVQSNGGSMVDYYVGGLVERDVLDFPTLLAVWQARLRHMSGLVDELDRLLTERLLGARPIEMAEPIFDVVRAVARGDPSYGLYASTDLALLRQLAAAWNADAVWQELAEWPEKELRWALHHMHWGGNEPEPLVRRFLVSDRLNEMANEASVCFYNTLGIVMGPYHLALQRELERAESWAHALAGTPAAAWADELVEKYRRDIEWQREREAEENMRLR